MRKIILSASFMFFSFFAFSQIFDAELLNRKTDIVISNGKLIKNESFEIKIINQKGEKFTEIEIPFSKQYKVDKIEAFVKDSQGNIIRKLKNKEITEKSDIADFSLYEDDYVKKFTLKHNEYPYIICYSYQIQENEFTDIVNWIPLLDGEIPTLNAELSLTIPKDYSIRIQEQFVDQPEMDSVKNTIKYYWKASYNQKLKSEKFSPPLIDFLPSVTIVANKFKYVVNGKFHNWNEYSNWAFQLTRNINTLTDNEKIKITNQISGIDNNITKIRTLYHYLQDNTRYINVSINKGGIVPYPASYVCDNKYGDCKALTNYFKSVLEYIGIKAYYTLVYGGDVIPKTSNDFPMDKFNHIILYVPLENDTIWLDCTSKGPFNYLGTFTQNRSALVVDDVKGGIVSTPKLTSEDVLETRNITVKPEENGLTDISFIDTYRGKMFERLSQLETYYNSKDKDEILRNYFIPDNLDLKDYQIIKSNRDDKNIKLLYNVTASSVYKKYGNEIVLSNIEFDIPQIEKPSDRKLPVQINYPINKSDTIEYYFPEGYILDRKPQDVSIYSLPYGTYNLKFMANKNSIQVIKDMLINSGEYALSDYQKFYDFCNTILNLEKGKHIILKPQN